MHLPLGPWDARGRRMRFLGQIVEHQLYPFGKRPDLPELHGKPPPLQQVRLSRLNGGLHRAFELLFERMCFLHSLLRLSLCLVVPALQRAMRSRYAVLGAILAAYRADAGERRNAHIDHCFDRK